MLYYVIGKPAVIISQNATNLAFDLNTKRMIIYENDKQQKNSIRKPDAHPLCIVAALSITNGVVREKIKTEVCRAADQEMTMEN